MFDGKFEQINLDVSRVFSFGGSGCWQSRFGHCSSFRCQEIEIDVGLVEKCVTKSGDNKNVNW